MWFLCCSDLLELDDRFIRIPWRYCNDARLVAAAPL
jgi:hypothetical protein